MRRKKSDGDDAAGRAATYFPSIDWIEVAELSKLGHGIVIHHDWVPSTAVAYIVGWEWLKKAESSVTVRVLRPYPSFPISVVKGKGTDKGTDLFGSSEGAASGAPLNAADWGTVIRDVTDAVRLILGKRLVQQGRLNDRVRFQTNC